jgi:cytochrome c-type biogenesis protein CcmH/NrfF
LNTQSELELEQRTNIKFVVKLGKSGNEIREILVKVYGDNARITSITSITLQLDFTLIEYKYL